MNSEKATRETRQKNVILEELRAVTSHPTAEQLYDLVRRRLPRVSLGTIYRNLSILEKGGEVLSLETAGRRKRFDGNVKDHYHIRCNECGRVDDVPKRLTTGVDQELAKSRGYQLTGHSLEFHGLCPSCK